MESDFSSSGSTGKTPSWKKTSANSNGDSSNVSQPRDVRRGAQADQNTGGNPDWKTQRPSSSSSSASQRQYNGDASANRNSRPSRESGQNDGSFGTRNNDRSPSFSSPDNRETRPRRDGPPSSSTSTGSNSRSSPSSSSGDYGSRQRRESTSFSREEKNEYYSNEFGRAERNEPSYGYYDGDHVFGISPVRLALLSKKRVMSELLIQSGMDSNRKDQKSVNEILKLCQQLNIPVREFTKHDLNMLTDSRPHQGFVLRATPRTFIPLDSLPATKEFKCVLVLDEVWDPQNFGALLRTSHFLGCDKVVSCAKNSAPLSPSVSKASSGALEIMDVYSTNNLMKFLDKSRENGWQVVGTSLSPSAVGLEQVVLDSPTIVVLGNEGHGIRTNILRRCTQQIKIPSFASMSSSSSSSSTSDINVDIDVSESITSSSTDSIEMMMEDGSSNDTNNSDGSNNYRNNPSSTSSLSNGGDGEDAVDSLNVSVTGGIILHHILRSGKIKSNANAAVPFKE